MYHNIRNIREGFVQSDTGDGLVRAESVIIGIVLFFLCLLYFKIGPAASAVLGIGIGGAFPYLIGLVKIFAWIAIAVFSVFWAIVGYFIGGAILGNSPAAGFVVAIMCFIFSVFAHKVFAGIGYVSKDKYVLDTMEYDSETLGKIANHLSNLQNSRSGNTSEEKIENTKRNPSEEDNRTVFNYCPNCGNKIKSGENFCANCGIKVHK